MRSLTRINNNNNYTLLVALNNPVFEAQTTLNSADNNNKKRNNNNNSSPFLLPFCFLLLRKTRVAHTTQQMAPQGVVSVVANCA